MPHFKGIPPNTPWKGEDKLATRNKAIIVRLTEEEHEHLKQQARNTGLKMEPLVRKLIAGCSIVPYPPEAFGGLLKALSHISNDLNQLVHISYLAGQVNPEELHKARELTDEAIMIVRKAFLCPESKKEG